MKNSWNYFYNIKCKARQVKTVTYVSLEHELFLAELLCAVYHTINRPYAKIK